MSNTKQPHVWVVESLRQRGSIYAEAASPYLFHARKKLKLYRDTNKPMKFRLVKYVRAAGRKA